jgi:hypothetical protein
VQPAGGIDDDDIGAAGDRRLDPVEGHGRRIGPVLVFDDVGADPLRPYGQLFDRSGAKGITGHQQDRPAGGAIAVRQFADRRRLADAVHADDEDDLRRVTVRRRRRFRQELAHRPLDHPAELVGIADLADLAPPPLEQGLGRLHADVGAEQHLLDPGQPGIAIAGARPGIDQPPGEVAAGAGQTQHPRVATRRRCDRALGRSAARSYRLPSRQRNGGERPDRHRRPDGDQGNEKLMALHAPAVS